jgi:hypothetical protein
MAVNRNVPADPTICGPSTHHNSNEKQRHAAESCSSLVLVNRGTFRSPVFGQRTNSKLRKRRWGFFSKSKGDGQAAQKASEARRAMIGERRRTSAVRWSETTERNAAYEAFSAACR